LIKFCGIAVIVLGDKVTLNGSDQKYKIVGFLKNAKINIAPIAYGTMATWREVTTNGPEC
jgi:putative ABC transport system permease protein